MIERICPKCRVPMNGDKCIKPNCGCSTEMSSTIYWCKDCNIPIYEKVCPICGNEGKYVATDVRPVFPEENALISILLKKNPKEYQCASVWFGSGAYIIDGKKIKLSVSKVNKLPIEDIRIIKEQYENFVVDINYEFFDDYIVKFIKANKDRYNYITEEAVNYIQQYQDKYKIEDMESTDYTLRVVHSQNQLREKAYIFDMGLDDRVVEIMKVMMVAHLSQTNPDLEVGDIFLEITKGKPERFVIRLKNGVLGNSPFSQKVYDAVKAEYIDSKGDGKRDYIVDMNWAVECLKNK